MPYLGSLSIRYVTVLVLTMAVVVVVMALVLWATGGAPVLAFAVVPALVAAFDGGRLATIRWGGMTASRGWVLSLVYLLLQAVVSVVMVVGIQALYALAFAPPEGFARGIVIALVGYLILIRCAVWAGAMRARRSLPTS